jgi:pyruvate/2-oxoglutarate dehydrogenase complex dihydrolipoamide acyltransferase (E2) component
MARFSFRLPDIGEGIAEAEIVAWHAKIGDRIEEDSQLADMMTDKATVEMESPVSGVVVELAGEVGDMVAIGSTLAVIEVEGEGEGEAQTEIRDEILTPVTNPARPELVEGPSLSLTSAEEKNSPSTSSGQAGLGGESSSGQAGQGVQRCQLRFLHRPPCARAPPTWASILRRSTPPMASGCAMPISMPICAIARVRAITPRTIAVRALTNPSRWSACAAALRKI